MFPSWPSYSKNEAKIVSDIILSNKVNYWTGNEGIEFEKEFNEHFGCNYSIALNNGTVALDLALYALNIGLGDEVIVTPRSFIASVSSIINAKAKPIFADIDLNSHNITANTIEPLINKNTKAILCVHIAGFPCEMDEIIEIAKTNNLFIIEDCAQAHGAKYKGISVGNFSEIGAWSFCQDKIITTGGEGGMISTYSKEYWSKIWSYKDHGKSWEKVYNKKHKIGFRWLHDSFGTNARMTEIQSALGRYQLKKLKSWSEQRLKNSYTIWNYAKSIDGLVAPIIPEYIDHAAYKCNLLIEENALKTNWSRDRVIDEINKKGIPCFSGPCPEIYNEKAFDLTDLRPKKPLLNAKFVGQNSLMFNVHPTLGSSHINKTIDILNDIFHKAKR